MVVDASVLAKLFTAEDLSAEARQVVDGATELWAPAHAFAELAEILSRKLALGEVTPEQCELAVEAVVRLVQSAPLDDLLAPAIAVAGQLNLAVYDTLYLVLASGRGDQLVTWDKRLLRRVKGSRFEQLARPLDPNWVS